MATRGVSQIARQACDACRVRKRKCDYPSSPDLGSSTGRGSPVDNHVQARQCRRCSSLDLPCTFLLPVAARGPRKREKPSSPRRVSVLEQPSPGLSLSGETQMSSPQSIFNTTDRHDIPIPTDSICARPLIKLILNDYLNYLYPLIPVVHRPSFQADLERGRDSFDKSFLELIVALCAATVGILPRKFQDYRNATPPLRFKTRTEMINQCYEVCLGLQGSDYYDEINYKKWASSYLMQIAFFQIGQHNRQRMVEVEAMQLARLLGFHQLSTYDGLNCIETQLRKKGFWLMFYGYVHSQLQNLRKERLTYLDATILSSINLEELMPVEVDDEFIHKDFILPQPATELSLTTGFNVASRIFWASLISLAPFDSPTAKEQYCSCVRSKNPDLQAKHLQARLHDLKYMLDGVPAQLKQWSNGREDEDPSSPGWQNRRIVRAQFEAMRANIHVSHLWLQGIISDQLDALMVREGTEEGSIAAGSRDRWGQREDICRQLLHVLHGIPETYLEPNGHHLTYKVRDVAVTLLACPFDPQHEVSRRAFEYVREFTEILSRLDGSETINTSSLQSWVDTGRRIGSE